jgi:hypothetical protein
LYFYGARWYDSYLNRWVQPDSVIPDYYNPQDWDRYSYTRNNPIKYTDPYGHSVDCGLGDPYCKAGKLDIWHRAYDLANEIRHRNPQTCGKLTDTEQSILREPVIADLHGNKDCTTAKPCLGAWYEPSKWDTDPANPDYIAFTLSGGELVVGGFVLVVDRYGQIFVGICVGVGGSITPVSGTFVRGYIRASYNKADPSGPSVTQNFISGFSINASVGFIGGFGFTYNPSEFETAFESGLFIPEWDITGVYLWPITSTQYNIPIH